MYNVMAKTERKKEKAREGRKKEELTSEMKRTDKYGRDGVTTMQARN